ncbi:nitroreductase family protein [Candidatus Riflebacteria bacterium]
MMQLFKIDREKCRQDGICKDVCPVNIITTDEKGYPKPLKNREYLCLNCGHCMAVCPSSAFSLCTMPPESCIPVNPDLAINEEQIVHHFKTRRSSRIFQEKQVPRDILERLLDITRYAPNAENAQPLNWLIIESKEEVKRYAGLVVDGLQGKDKFRGVILFWKRGNDMIFRGAPNVIIAHAPKGGFNPQIDCIIALSHLELAAPAFGLGACWAGFMMAASEHKPLIEALKIPEDHRIYGAMILGYPAHGYKRIPLRNPAKIKWL